MPESQNLVSLRVSTRTQNATSCENLTRVAAHLRSREERISMEEALGDDYERFLSIGPDAVSYAELFE